MLASCSTASAPLVPAENGLDAGREFIDACLKGDFERASFYMMDTKENKAILDNIEKEYREKFANPYVAAKYGYIDDVIEPRNTRFRIIRAFEMLQTKRLTNPLKKHSNIPL